MKHLFGLAILLGTVGPAHALTIAEINLNDFAFDISSYATGSNIAGVADDATASGTSGGVSWSISPTSLWSGRTNTEGTFQFAALPVLTDNLHPSMSYTITFAKPVQALLVALSNDNTTDTINFGLVPTDYSGLSLNGTQLTLNNPAGGLALFENIYSLSIQNTNNNGLDDGYDLAFYVISTVPEPNTFSLLALGMLGLTGLSLYRTRLSSK